MSKVRFVQTNSVERLLLVDTRARPRRLRLGQVVANRGEVFSAPTVIGVMLDNPRVIGSKLVTRLHFRPTGGGGQQQGGNKLVSGLGLATYERVFSALNRLN